MCWLLLVLQSDINIVSNSTCRSESESAWFQHPFAAACSFGRVLPLWRLPDHPSVLPQRALDAVQEPHTDLPKAGGPTQPTPPNTIYSSVIKQTILSKDMYRGFRDVSSGAGRWRMPCSIRDIGYIAWYKDNHLVWHSLLCLLSAVPIPGFGCVLIPGPGVQLCPYERQLQEAPAPGPPSGPCLLPGG